MSATNEFLAGYYGTGANSGNDADALEKMAQLTLLVKEAEENDIDISSLSDEDAMELAEELYGDDSSDAGEQTGEEDLEKEAQAKFEEADFLGRVMAHSMWQELDNIQKEAGAVGDAASKAWKWVKAAPGKAHGATLGRIGEAAAEAAEKRTAGSIAKQPGRMRKQYGVEKARKMGKGSFTESEAAKIMRRGRQANIAAQAGTAVGATGALAGGGYAAHKALKKKGSALNSLVEQRAIEHLAAAGYVDQQGNVYSPVEKTASNDDFNMMVDKAALELLEQNGYQVQWR